MSDKTNGITAGCGSITDEQVDEAAHEIFDGGDFGEHEETFYMGFLTGLQFIAMPEDADTYGCDVAEFAQNAYMHLVEREIKEAAAAFAESLEERFGINVNSLMFMRPKAAESDGGDE